MALVEMTSRGGLNMLTKEDIELLIDCITLIEQYHGENAKLEELYRKLLKMKEED